ncbi:hypothetical protein LguiA_035734 [Lonicera macranthoides]
MGRIPCCEKDNVKRGQWTPEEDNKLSSYIAQHGTRNWRLIPKNAGLQRCGKSCRLRWTNYLRPDLKHGQFSDAEEQTIVKLHSVVGNRWSIIAAQLPGRTDNDVKNHWNTKLKKKLSGMGIDPVTHKPFSHLMAEIATTLAPPQVANLTEAALGCFKDEMLHLLTKKHIDFQLQQSGPTHNINAYQKDDMIERIKLRTMIQEPNMVRMGLLGTRVCVLGVRAQQVSNKAKKIRPQLNRQILAVACSSQLADLFSAFKVPRFSIWSSWKQLKTTNFVTGRGSTDLLCIRATHYASTTMFINLSIEMKHPRPTEWESTSLLNSSIDFLQKGDPRISSNTAIVEPENSISDISQRLTKESALPTAKYLSQ